jgi:hypothetical protein
MPIFQRPNLMGLRHRSEARVPCIILSAQGPITGDRLDSYALLKCHLETKLVGGGGVLPSNVQYAIQKYLEDWCKEAEVQAIANVNNSKARGLLAPPDPPLVTDRQCSLKFVQAVALRSLGLTFCQQREEALHPPGLLPFLARLQLGRLGISTLSIECQLMYVASTRPWDPPYNKWARRAEKHTTMAACFLL